MKHEATQEFLEAEENLNKSDESPEKLWYSCRTRLCETNIQNSFPTGPDGGGRWRG